MKFILVIWAVAAGGNSSYFAAWKPMGEFVNESWCQHAAALMSIPANEFRCLPTGYDNREPPKLLPVPTPKLK